LNFTEQGKMPIPVASQTFMDGFWLLFGRGGGVNVEYELVLVIGTLAGISPDIARMLALICQP
jgi:hypothetical protein